jgi:predicted nucleotidyltransferase component of viral defense system
VACQVRLFEHPDFDQLIVQAREHFAQSGITEQLIEKDYYVTEVLRIVADKLRSKAIFKGGTSLSKGWGLIDRFSEDVDLFVDPQRFEPALGKNGIDRELKKLRDQVAAHPALELLPGQSKTSGGFGRSDDFRYPQKFVATAGIRNTVRLESGTASGREPVVDIAIESYIGRFLREKGVELRVADQRAFPMRVMHFRRTFVEKMFAIHGRVEIFKRDGVPIGTYARHYYDLFQLLHQPEVHEMIASDEYLQIKEDYKRISQASFSRDYFEPLDMRFSSSDALFPTPEIRLSIKSDYERECSILCYGAFPAFNEVEQAFCALKTSL